MGTPYFPIKNITTYCTNWTLLAKIVEKSPLKKLKEDNNLLYIDITDQNGDTIRAKFWGVAATKWNDLLQKGNVYTFSKGTVNVSNKKYNSLPHNYELVFNLESKIEPSNELGDIKVERNYDFVSLRDIKSTSREPPFVVDILCFAKSLTPVSVTNTRQNRETKRRSLYVVDDTSHELEVTFWGDMTELPIFDTILDKPVIVSQVVIKEWNGTRVAQTNPSSDIKFASYESVRNKERLANLESWYHHAMSQNEVFKTMKTQNTSSGRESTEFSTIDNALLKSKGNFTFNCKLRKVYWKNKDGVYRLWYKACPTCFKKVVEEQDTKVCRCISCDDAIVTPVLRYILSCMFIDFTGHFVTTVYGEIGEKLVGYTVQDLEAMDKERLQNVLDFDVLHKDFKISGFFKTKIYNGESKVSFNITSVENVDYVKEAEFLLDKMQITYDSVEKFLGLKKHDLEGVVKKLRN